MCEIQDNINVKAPEGMDRFSTYTNQEMYPLQLYPLQLYPLQLDYSVMANGLKLAMYQYLDGSLKKKETVY